MRRPLYYLLLLIYLGSCKPEEQNQRPNVILIVTDDQGYGDIGFHGNNIIRTPRLDAFEKQAFELTNFHSGTTCTPTRAGIMTGRNANRNGAWHTIAGASILNDGEQTIAEVFNSNGYKTGMFGKWHLGDNYPYRPFDRGFDEVFYHGGGGVQQTPDYWNNDYFDDTYFRNGVPEKTRGYCTDVWFDETIKFIEKQDEDPFFIYLATNAAHGPFNVPESYRASYEGADLKPHQKRFYGMISNVDDNFGRLEDYLKEEGLFDNTILIFTTDNGTAGGDSWDKEEQKRYGFNPLRGTKGSHYDGGHRVPFLISWPKGGLGRGAKSNALVSHVDLLPTLTNMTRVNFEPIKPLDGADISGLFDQSVEDEERMLIVDTQRNQWPERYRNPCVMQGAWRLVNHTELYDTEADLAQKTNVASKYPERVQSMQTFYDQWWASTENDWKHSPHFIGTENQNPVMITIHDMHPDDESDPIPWNQVQIRDGKFFPSGFYNLDVKSTGKYQFELFRYPVETGFKLSERVEAVEETPSVDGLPLGNGILPQEAYLSFDDNRQSMEVDKSAVSAKFEVELNSGMIDLRAGFTGDQGKEMSAYYIQITKM
ncbi:MAG: arylsulfatase [Cyclobacteriaceae bacterium]